MAVYTVSINFLTNIKDNEMDYFASILFQLANTMNPAKLAIDKDKTIISKYREIKNHAETIKCWLDLISYSSSCWESIDVDLKKIDDSEEMCFALCSKINGARGLIVHSVSSLRHSLEEDNCLVYNGVKIKVLDKDEAKEQLNLSNMLTLVNSTYVGGSAGIVNNKNNRN